MLGEQLFQSLWQINLIFNIFLWVFEEDVKNDINNDNVNTKYLKGIKLPKI